MTGARPQIVTGWKAIAAYLGCAPKTARGYEDDGLPVYRHKGRVRALASELEAWVQKGYKKGIIKAIKRPNKGLLKKRPRV